MSVRALPALLLAAACSLVPVTAGADGPGVEPLRSSVFRIEARDGRGGLNSGSGVMVAPHILVTNCHVVLNSREVSVARRAGRFPARLIRAHVERDLCLLDVPGLEGTAVTLGKTADKEAGELITAIGYPVGEPLARSRGQIEGLHTYLGAGRVVQGSAGFSPGKSGGGLFDKNERLIGILTFKCRAGGPYHFAVPAEWVVALLNDTSNTPPAPTDKPFWQLTDERQPVFVRAASLSAEGDCAALKALAAQWLAREPGNPESALLVKRANSCDAHARLIGTAAAGG